MMRAPLEHLREKTDSRYTLVVSAAKRARQLLDGAPRLLEVESKKPVTIALQELANDKLKFERNR